LNAVELPRAHHSQQLTYAHPDHARALRDCAYGTPPAESVAGPRSGSLSRDPRAGAAAAGLSIGRQKRVSLPSRSRLPTLASIRVFRPSRRAIGQLSGRETCTWAGTSLRCTCLPRSRSTRPVGRGHYSVQGGAQQRLAPCAPSTL